MDVRNSASFEWKLWRIRVCRITFKRIIKNRSTEKFSGIPYVMTLLNCLLSAWWASRIFFHFTVYLYGLLPQIFCQITCTFYRFCGGYFCYFVQLSLFFLYFFLDIICHFLYPNNFLRCFLFEKKLLVCWLILKVCRMAGIIFLGFQFVGLEFSQLVVKFSLSIAK